MAKRPLVQSTRSGGSPDDDRLLRSVAADVVAFDSELAEVIRDLRDTMDAYDVCVGLAAPQIGFQLRVAIADIGEQDPLVMVNPSILERTGKRDLKRESCMSIWGLAGTVERREKILVRFQDQVGELHERRLRGFAARVVQHEVDHLDGLLYDVRVLTGGLVTTELFDG